jgi:hypothetical protein
MVREPEPILGRYRFVRRLPSVARALVWLTQDEETGRGVIASLLPASRATGLEPIVGMTHPHAAQVIAVLDEWDRSEVPEAEAPLQDAALVLADHVLGGSLHQRLQSGRPEAIKAVRWAERTADVLAMMHRMGGVHGALSPRSIVVAQPSQGIAPVLTHLFVPPAGAYCSPDRVTGGGPSEADDVWALVATLYTVLAGHPPFLGSNRKELARAIVRGEVPPLDELDAELFSLVQRGLHRSPALRIHDAGELQAALAAWLRNQGADLHQGIAQGIETDFPGAPSDRPSIADDRALQDAVNRPGSEDALLPVSVAPPAPSPPIAEPEPSTPAPDGAGDEAAAPPASPGSEMPAEAPPHPAANAASAPEGSAPHEPDTLSSAGDAEVARDARAGSASEGTRRRSPVAAFVLAGLVLASGAYLLWQRTSTPDPAPPTPAAAVPRYDEPPPAPTPASAAASVAPASTLEAPGAPPAIPDATPEVPEESPASTPAECLVATFPEGTFGHQPSLDFVCAQADLWGSARRLSALANRRGRGEGARVWSSLGRYELPAVALMRARCCGDVKPPTAATVTTRCAPPLTDVLRDVAREPSDEHVAQFEETFQCLERRQLRYPGGWDRVPVEPSREHFDALRARLRKP